MVCVAKTYFFFSKKENNIRRIKKAVSLQSEDRVPPVSSYYYINH